MLQIRVNVFESNSSSTHSICISKKPATLGSYVNFHLGEYEWEFEEVDIRDYLYTAIMCHDCVYNRVPLWLPKLKNILDKNGIMYDFERPTYSEWGTPEFGIDHATSTFGFVETVLNDEDMLMRLLFNSESVVYTGNDNAWGDENEDDKHMCDVAHEWDWKYDKNTDEFSYEKLGNWDNVYYDPDNFDYFYKSN